VYKAHSCTTQFQSDIRERGPGENGASEDIDAFVLALRCVKNGGPSRETAPEGHAKG